MSQQNIVRDGGRLSLVPAKGIDLKQVEKFCNRSNSEETRRAYRRALKEFFHFLGHASAAEVSSEDVIRWRDHLQAKKKSASTVALKLSILRSYFDFLRIEGEVSKNPASTKAVPPPQLPEDMRGRALTPEEVRRLLAAPHKGKPEGARDYALMLLMLKTSLRVSEACRLRTSSINRSHGRWVIRVKVKGGRERTLPLPADVKRAIDEYLRLDKKRRSFLHSDGDDPYVFQPLVNYRTLVFNKPISPTMVWQIVRRWGAFSGIGEVSPHDLRRTAITQALNQGLSYRQVQMMTGHRDPKTVMKYDHDRENIEQNAANFLDYGDLPT